MTSRHLLVAGLLALLAPSAVSVADDAAPAEPAARAASRGALVDRVAAVVGSDIIMLSEVYDIGSNAIAEACPAPASTACRVEAEGMVLDALIRRSLMRDELNALGADVTGAEVDAAIGQVVKDNGFPDRETLRREVEATGATWSEYRMKLEEQLRVQRFQQYVLRNRVTISVDEIQDLYTRLARDVDAPVEVRLAGFGQLLPAGLSPDEAAAAVQELRGALAEVRDGARTWAELAAERDTANVGGLFEGRGFAEGELLPALSKAAFATEPGNPTEPVLLNGVLYALFVLSREKGEVELPPLEAVQPDIEARLFEDKLYEAEDAWYESARRRTAVRVLLDTAPPGPS